TTKDIAMATTPTGLRRLPATVSLTVAALAIAGGSIASAEGIATIARFFGTTGTALAVAIQADGRVIAAGSNPGTVVTDSDFAVARFNPDGTPDATFGT